MPSKYKPVREGIFYSEKHGRIVVHHGYSVRIHWSKDMLDYLKQHYATTLNEELAGCLGVSPRTMIRKARELGLEKDNVWLRGVYEERRRLAMAASKRKGYPSRFKKGVRTNPAGEFKRGHVDSEETKAKRAASLKKWCLTHPKELKARAAKIAEIRRKNKENAACSLTAGGQI